MCIHPDDPPMRILGLPRIITSVDDIRWMLNAVDNPHNGVTFCAGSLSASVKNNVSEMAREFAPRTWFVHLRSTIPQPNGDFREAGHLGGGRADLIELVQIFEKLHQDLPMRVDHAQCMLGDEDRGYNPGYSFHSRMLALGQIAGVMASVEHYNKEAEKEANKVTSKETERVT